MQEMKSNLIIRFVTILFIFSSCISDSKYAYTEQLAKDIESDYAEGSAFSEFSSNQFYIDDKIDSTFFIVPYRELLRGYGNSVETQSAEEYLKKLFSGKLKPAIDAIAVDQQIYMQYKGRPDEMVKQTSRSSNVPGKRYLRTDLRMTGHQIETLLLLYARMGYLIGEDDYMGVVTLMQFD